MPGRFQSRYLAHADTDAAQRLGQLAFAWPTSPHAKHFMPGFFLAGVVEPPLLTERRWPDLLESTSRFRGLESLISRVAPLPARLLLLSREIGAPAEMRLGVAELWLLSSRLEESDSEPEVDSSPESLFFCVCGGCIAG